MESGALSDAAFAEFGKQVVLFCHITSHVETDPYQDLLSEKGGMGFPYLVFMDAKGEVLATHKGPRSVEAFASTASALTSLEANRAKAAAGDAAAVVAVFQAELDLGQLSFEEANKRFEELRQGDDSVFAADDLARIQQNLINLDFEETLSSLPRRDRELAIKTAGEKVMAMQKAGRIPDGMYGRTFYGLMIEYGKVIEDKEVTVSGIKAFQGILDPDEPADERLREYLDKELEKVK